MEPMELIDLTPRDIRLDKPAVITLHGKGQKTRQVPIMENTKDLLAEYLSRTNHTGGWSAQDQYSTISKRGSLPDAALRILLINMFK